MRSSGPLAEALATTSTSSAEHRRRSRSTKPAGRPTFPASRRRGACSSCGCASPRRLFRGSPRQICAVPPETPVVPTAENTRPLGGPVLPRGAHRLRRGPEAKSELRGATPAAPRRDRLRVRIAPGQAASQIANGTLDYFLEWRRCCGPTRGCARRRRSIPPDADLAPDPLLTSTSIGRSSRTPACVGQSSTCSTDGRLLQAGPGGARSRQRVFSFRATCPGSTTEPLYPLRGDLRTARRLAAGRTGRVVVCCTWVGDRAYAEAFNRALREQLAAIGLRMSVLSLRQGVLRGRVSGEGSALGPDLGRPERAHRRPRELPEGPASSRRATRRSSDRIQTLFAPRARARSARTREEDRAGVALRGVPDGRAP